MIRDALRELSEIQKAKPDVGRNVGANVGRKVVTNEDKLLELLRQDGHLTAKVLASSLDLTPRQVERMLAGLKQAGKVIRHGATKNGYWEVK